MASMKPIEKLAREICWLEFSPAGQKGKTKAAYWKGIAEHAREMYRADARRFAYWIRHVNVDVLNKLN